MSDVAADAVPWAFGAPLTVCVDVKDPQAWLTLAPVRAMAAELAIDVDWLPFPAAAARPPPQESAPGRATDRGTRHRITRARYQQLDLERYAAAQGLTLRDPYRTQESTFASLGLLWLRGHAPDKSADYLARAFAAWWAAEPGAASAAAIGGIIEQLGEDPAAFEAYASGPGPGALGDLRLRLVAAGVFTVPSLVVEGEVFVGRAHLPMARWLLTGRAGAPPI